MILDIYEVLDKVLGYLSVKELFKARIICKTFYSLVFTASTWDHYFESHNVFFVNEKVRKHLLWNPRDCFLYTRYRITCSVLTEFIELQLKDATNFVHGIPPICVYSQHDAMRGFFSYNDVYCKINYICPERKDVSIMMGEKCIGLEEYVNLFGIKDDNTLNFTIYFEGYIKYLDNNKKRAELLEFLQSDEGFCVYLQKIWETMCFTIVDTGIEWPSHSYKSESILTSLFSYFMKRKSGKEYAEKSWNELFEYYKQAY